MNAPAQDTNVLFPVARVVQGDLYKAQDKDNQGNPLVIKTGPNAGKPRVNFFFAIAVPKTPGLTHWAHESWGQKIWALGHAWWPQGQAQQPRFAWKIEDGDDATPNQNNKRNCDREGFPGNWIIQLGSSYAPKIFDESGNPMLQEGLVRRGFWVEVFANLASNENAQNPGIYINHSMVAYRAPGKEITSGPDPRAVGFGRAALPPGVTAAPISNTANLPGAPAAPTMPSAPAVPGAPAAAPQAPAPAVPAAAHPGFIAPPVPGAVAPAVPGAPAVPAAPPAAPAAPAAPSVVDPLGAPMGFKMANPNGPNYASFKSGGWTDDQLVQNRHMVKL